MGFVRFIFAKFANGTCEPAVGLAPGCDDDCWHDHAECFFPEFRRLWNGVMLFGVLSGALFVVQPRWTPSSLIIDIARSIQNHVGEPSVTQLLIALMLLLGMFLGARVSKTFALARPTMTDVLVHLGAGTMMGIGGYLSLGGNDIQLLQAVPVISPAGIGAVVCMLAGIWLGLRMMKR
jgi:hypothetical protein